jgi:hypothetical protein
MVGNPGTPLWRKLGLTPATIVQLVHASPGWAVQDVPHEVRWLEPAEAGHADVIIAFYGNAADYETEIAVLARRIHPDGAVWIAWPRKAAGHVSDLGDAVVRDAALAIGLVDVKVAAIDDDWSGLKLVWRVELRSSSRY